MRKMQDQTSLPDRPLALERAALGLVLGLALARLALAGHALLSSDESYYWHWIHPLQLSYLDHPAMVAWWIWGGVQLLGETALGVRLPAVLGSLVTTALVWDTARLAFRSRAAGAWAAILINSTVLFSSAGVIVTPDTPLLVFWSLALWGFVRLIALGQARYIFVVGAALGLGAISKYTIALILPGAVATFLLFPGPRAWLKRPATYGAVLLSLACTWPLILWNMQNDYASFRKQLGHAFDVPAPVKPLPNLLSFLGSQVGLVTPILFALCLWAMGWALWRGWKDKRPEWFLLGAASAPILAFFAQHALSGLVQAHWGGPAYLGACIALAGFATRRRWLMAGSGLGVLLTLALFFQAGTAALPIPIKIDALKRLGGWDELAQAVQQERDSHPQAFFLFTEKHEATGPVSFYLPDHAPVFLQGHIRPSYVTPEQVAALGGHDALFITESRSASPQDYVPQWFGKLTLLRSVDLHWGKKVADRYDIYLAEGYEGGMLVQGDGWNGERDSRVTQP